MLERIKEFFKSLVFVQSKPEPEVKKEPEVNIPKNIKVEPPPVKTTTQKRTRKPKQNGTSKKQSK